MVTDWLVCVLDRNVKLLLLKAEPWLGEVVDDDDDDDDDRRFVSIESGSVVFPLRRSKFIG